MPQPDRAAGVGRLRVADGVDQIHFNRAPAVQNPTVNLPVPVPVATGRGNIQPAAQ
jgi:hypothetical protein